MMTEALERQLEGEFGGCYLLMDGNEVVYVGESNCVPFRIKQHITQGIKQFDSYKYYHCTNRKELESALIKLLQPKYNISENPACRIGYSNRSQESKLQDCIDRAVELTKSVGKPIPIPFGVWYKQQNFPSFRDEVVKKVIEKYNCFMYVDTYHQEVYDYRVLAQYEDVIYAEASQMIFEENKRIAEHWANQQANK